MSLGFRALYREYRMNLALSGCSCYYYHWPSLLNMNEENSIQIAGSSMETVKRGQKHYCYLQQS